MSALTNRTPERHFLKNISTVAGGAALAQAITLLFSPIITRLFGPEAYGVQGVFVSVLMLLSTIVCLGYPTAIILCKSDAEAAIVARLSLFIAILISLIIASLLFVFGHDVLQLLKIESIGPYFYLLPVAVFFCGTSTIISHFFIRSRAFLLMAKLNAANSLALNVLKTTGGMIHPSGLVLISIASFGHFLNTVISGLAWCKSVRHKSAPTAPDDTSHGYSGLAIKYWDFPLLRTPQTFLSAISNSLPLILLGMYFGPTTAGLYALTLAVLSVPGNIAGQSVTTVFYPRVTKSIEDDADTRGLIFNVTSGMFLAGLIPCLALIVFGPSLFQFIFGSDWGVAGEYAQWLTPWFFLQFLNKPAVAAIPALRIQGGLLIYELFSTAVKLISLWLGFYIFQSAEVSVALFSISGSIAYVILIAWVLWSSGKNTARQIQGHTNQ